MPQSFFSIVQMYFIQFSYETSKCKKVQDDQEMAQSDRNSHKKVQDDQEMAQSDRNSHSINRGMGKNINKT